MPEINGVKVTTELEVKLITALSELYKMNYYYFKKSSTASVETQAKRTLAICKLLDVIKAEFNPPTTEEHSPSSAIPPDLLPEEGNEHGEIHVNPDDSTEGEEQGGIGE